MGNDTQTLTLTDFLLARIAEDEEFLDDLRRNAVWNTECVPISLNRFQRECEAKRRIMDIESYDRPKFGAPPYNGPLNDIDGGRHRDLIAYIEEYGERVTDTACLRALALPYADHPDYRDDWRP